MDDAEKRAKAAAIGHRLERYRREVQDSDEDASEVRNHVLTMLVAALIASHPKAEYIMAMVNTAFAVIPYSSRNEQARIAFQREAAILADLVELFGTDDALSP